MNEIELKKLADSGKTLTVETTSEEDYKVLSEMKEEIEKLESIPVEERTDKQKAGLSELYKLFGQLVGQIQKEYMLASKTIPKQTLSPAQYGAYLQRKHHRGGQRKKKKGR